MKNLDAKVAAREWLRRPLCRRYAAVEFSILPRLSVKSRRYENRTICWAFGSLIKGECEILGAWNLDTESVTTTEMFGDLRNRGVEFIRCGLGNLGDVEETFLATFRMAALYPSIEQTVASAVNAVKPRHRAFMANLLQPAVGDSAEVTAAAPLTSISSGELRQKYPEILAQWDEAVAGFQPLFALPAPYRQLVRSVGRTAIGMQERLMRSIHHHGPFVDSAEAFDFVVDWLVRADLRLQRDAQAEWIARDALASQSGRFGPASGRAVGTPVLA